MNISILKPILVLMLFCFHLESYSQTQSKIWTPVTASKANQKEKKLRKTIPKHYDLFHLDAEKLTSLLEKAPSREFLKKTPDQIEIELPVDNGILKKFLVFEAPVLSENLQLAYPDIKSYVAKGIDDPSSMARFSVSKNGLHAAISSANHQTVYIDPYTSDLSSYICYSRKDLPENPDDFECKVQEDVNNMLTDIPLQQPKNADDSTLRTFRLALVCTGEYSRFHWRDQNIPDDAPDAIKKEAVLGAMNTTMTRVNALFERDLAITMVIVDNNTDVIFLNANTDNLTDDDADKLIEEGQDVCDEIIGFDNYDIGHVFSTGGGGLASIQAPCNSYKAEGVTGLPRPIGDSYDIDYVAHEIGHQFGARHTQNNPCSRYGRSSMETGSGSTIMGYAGICRPNVQNNSDDYFHAISIQQIWTNVTRGNSRCGQKSNTNNAPPVITEISDYVIPAGTPFILKGNGTDPDSENQLTYCWEQMDAERGTMPPEQTSTEGPLFRSLPPISSPDRYIPSLSTVISGSISSRWEVIPTVSRDIKFRLTVRDNAIGGGSTTSENIVVTTDDNFGPFTVTSQNEDEIWNVGSTQIITWDVANTNEAPINCTEVDILLSVNGGIDFPILLKKGVPNTGLVEINVPDDLETTSEARIMVAGTDHIFYQVNTSDFSIDSNPLSTENFDSSLTNFRLWPNPNNGIFTISLSDSDRKVAVEVRDIQGKVISEDSLENTEKVLRRTLDLSNLTNGIYFVTIINGNEKTITKRMIKS